MKSQKTAQVLGRNLARVQHTFDRVTAWGFRKMESVGKQKEVVDPNENKYARNAKKIGKSVFGFLGTAGDAFYKEYEKLKKRSL